MKNPLDKLRSHSLLRHVLPVMAIAVTCAAPAHADQEWSPNRPIRLVVPYEPGGSSDVIARAVANQMSETLGQTVIVENKGGGQGIIATQDVARSAPDGYTVLLGHVGTMSVNPSMMSNLPYDVERDFAPIVLLAKLPMVFAVGAKVPASTLKEFVDLAKSKPGKLNYGSAGPGSAGHLAFEMLKNATDIEVLHIPYKGTGAQTSDLLAGHIDAAAAGTPGLLPHAKAEKIKIIAVGAAQRLPVLPDVPTVAEQGYPGFESSQWFGLLAPIGTPPEAIERLRKDAVRALESPAVSERLKHDSSTPVGAGPEEFKAFIKAETERWGDVVKRANLANN